MKANDYAKRAAGVLLGLVTLASPALAGEIELTDGSVLEGNVGEATALRVSITVEGQGTRDYDASEVARVWPDGDNDLESGVRYYKSGNLDRAEPKFMEVLSGRASSDAKAHAAFFLAEIAERRGDMGQAVQGYRQVKDQKDDHFYAAVGLHRASQLLAGSGNTAGAIEVLGELQSDSFGPRWSGQATFELARYKLASDPQGALGDFRGLLRSPDATLRALGSCGEAHCVIQEDPRRAQGMFERVLLDREATSPAKGYAWWGIGTCEEDARRKVLAFLKSALLYPDNPQLAAAARDGAAAIEENGWEGAARLRGMAGGSPASVYTGDQPDATVMSRTNQYISSGLVMRLVDGLISQAAGDEKASLEFAKADALKTQGSQDPEKLVEYQELLEDLQQRYPDHPRSAEVGVSLFSATKDRALALIREGQSEGDDAKVAEGRTMMDEALQRVQGSIDGMTARVDELTDMEIREELDESGMEEKADLEFRRDKAELIQADSMLEYGQSFQAGESRRAEVLDQALAKYNHFVEWRGQYFHLLWFAYAKRGNALLALEKWEEAEYQFLELTAIEPPFVPEDPEARQGLYDLVKNICIQAYYGLTRCYNLQGKGQEAYDVSQQVDQNRWTQGWEDHPMGILLTFERAKALAGSGRGLEGAGQLVSIIREAQAVPDAEKVALGMGGIGLEACKALSELSDQTGGEIYSAESQYWTGVGYFLRERRSLAIAGFKGVLTAAQTPEEREQWVPKAVNQIGTMLFQEERYLEAALAFETIINEFPESPDGSDAIALALSASKSAAEQFGVDPDGTAPIAQYYQSIKELSRGPKIIMNDAAKLQQDENFEAAARRYLDVPELNEEVDPPRPVSFYPNALGNAGYCFFQASKKQNNPDLLQEARDTLARAAQVATEKNNSEALALASYYLGQLELEQDPPNPQAALEALAAFDDPEKIASDSRLAVRARYRQVQALLKLEPPQFDEAEEQFQKVKDRTNDPYLPALATLMYISAQNAATVAYNEGDLDASRELWRKAGRFAAKWIQTSKPETLEGSDYITAIDAAWRAGRWEDTVDMVDTLLADHPIPEPDPRELGRSDLIRNYDTARLYKGFALQELGRSEEAFTLLDQVRNTTYVMLRTDLERRGRFVQRDLDKAAKRYFIDLEFDGQAEKYWEVREATNLAELSGVAESAMQNGSYADRDIRTLSRPFYNDPILLDALSRAGWSEWERTQDQNLLSTKVQEGLNAMVLALRGMDQSFWNSVVGTSQLEPRNLLKRRWTADMTLLRAKIARQEWAEAAGDIKTLILLGRLAVDESGALKVNVRPGQEAPEGAEEIEATLEQMKQSLLAAQVDPDSFKAPDKSASSEEDALSERNEQLGQAGQETEEESNLMLYIAAGCGGVGVLGALLWIVIGMRKGNDAPPKLTGERAKIDPEAQAAKKAAAAKKKKKKKKKAAGSSRSSAKSGSSSKSRSSSKSGSARSGSARSGSARSGSARSSKRPRKPKA